MEVPDTETSGVRVFPPMIFIAGALVGLGLQAFLPLAIGPAVWGPPLRILGVVFLLDWLVLDIWAIVLFRRAGTTPNPTRPTTALTFEGPYRFSRNPMYLGMALMQAGVGLLANSWWPVVWLVPVIALLQRAVIGPEERYLERKFGDEYLRYKSGVRRWL